MTTTLSTIDPRTSSALPHPVAVTTSTELDRILDEASAARARLAATPVPTVSAALDAAARTLEEHREAIVRTADAETALGPVRLDGEVSRAANQLRMFARFTSTGEHLDLTIDTQDPGRSIPDLRRMNVPLGVVAVFGASNFPLAFGVAGGDVAAALAARCPVVVKGHPAHAGTSELVARLVLDALTDAGLPPGAYRDVVGAGSEIGQRLVTDDRVDAVGFTGSLRGGRALADAAAARPRPIPVYAEMGSLNPLVLTAEALDDDPAARIRAVAGAVQLGWGQFCTKPGVVVVPEQRRAHVAAALAAELRQAPPANLLTQQIASGFAETTDAIAALGSDVITMTRGDTATGLSAPATVIDTSAAQYLAHPSLREEIFGPATVVVGVQDARQLRDVLTAVGGTLTLTLHAASTSDPWAADVLTVAGGTAGRIIFNGVPTGVAVTAAQHHGGPYPSTNSTFTSVGTASVRRFQRPVAFQDLPDELLPVELQAQNVWRLQRRTDGAWG